MRIPGKKAARFTVRWLRNVAARKAVILGYHRVTEATWDPYGNNVSPAHFAQHLEAIRRYGNPLPLQDLVASLERGEVPDRAVVVTLDDGYVDNLTVARPLLRQWQMPATVFAVSGNFGREFWWDELSRRFAPPNPLPLRISIKNPDGDVHFPLPQGDARKDRLQALQQLHEILFIGPRETIRKVLEQLRPSVPTRSHDEPWHRCMTEEELRELASDDLIEIGAHTESHRPMAYLNQAEQRMEVTQCKAVLERVLERPVPSFSYPHGSYMASLNGLVKTAGHSSSCAAHSNVVRRKTDLYNLPRFWAADSDGSKFSRWLQFWLCT